eukprot:TRINITY_DN113601_c0_g1_i1.p2 TRINITY_DN113601_c0_g1~~TRINITY_DN113601_c0_g1_i1.p2  ORF type:complete len:361 (-),score=39.07 TRINITY_DN113601_c0_g1_i1:264-1346(-)
MLQLLNRFSFLCLCLLWRSGFCLRDLRVGSQTAAPESSTENASSGLVGGNSLLIMSDVDDTITCPTANRSATGAIAGYDSCRSADGKFVMKHNEIYTGYAAVLHFLAIGFKEAYHQIVSANPTPGKKYNEIAAYLDKATENCPQRLQALGLAAPAVYRDGLESGKWVHRGSVITSGLGLKAASHRTMGVRKLNQLVKQAQRHGSDRIVFLGDAGQGDVCAAVCFVAPEKCTEVFVGRFARTVAWWRRSYKYGWEYVQSGGKLDKDVQRFALIHATPGLNYMNEPHWKMRCLASAYSIAAIGIFGRDPRTGDPSSDYGSVFDLDVLHRSALDAAMEIGAVPKLSEEQLKSAGPVLSTDCQN